MIHVLVHITVCRAALDRWAALIAYHTRESRREPGCLRFEVLAGSDPCRFVLDEIWAGAAALDAHRGSAHYARWRAEMPHLQAEPRGHEEYTQVLPAAGRGKLVTDTAELAAALHGARVVFTNGCFDGLHAGHVACLHEARAQGDVLVVGLNADASVRRLKGTGRPFHNVRDRAALLMALECVDYLIIFEAASPLDLLATLRPAVLVKGGDYTPDQVVGAGLVASWGGRVHLVPHTGHSSTALAAPRPLTAAISSG